MSTAAPAPLVAVEALKKYFPARRSWFGASGAPVRAVDDVSFHIGRGETLGLVGESGCGKTTVGRAILRLIEPTAGRVWFDGLEVLRLRERELRRLRQHMQIVFQDPYSSLNPRMTIGAIVGEGMLVHGLARGKVLRERVAELLERVGLTPAAMHRYPHEFSGGQRQRIGIARAISVRPQFVVCDEAVSALDVSIQAQIVNLLQDLQRDFGLAYLFIAHDLSIVRHVSNRIAVMYLGEIVEWGTAEAIFTQPCHPYTRALLSAVPIPDPARKRRRILLQGDVPSATRPPSGCRFHTRCPQARPECALAAPPVKEHLPGQGYRCILEPGWTH